MPRSDIHDERQDREEFIAGHRYAGDIPRETANNAHAGTSWSPEVRGAQRIAEYCRELDSLREQFEQAAEAGGASADLLEAEWQRFRDGYRARYLDYLRAHARCLSILVAGPSRFPGRRNQKANASSDRRLQELLEWHKRAVRAAMRTLRPELQPIRKSDDDATERLQAKLAELEARRHHMKAVNAAWRKAGKPAPNDADGWAKVAESLGLAPGAIQSARLSFAACSWQDQPFAPYEMTNLGANIRRVRDQLETVQVAQATPATEAEGDGVRLEDCPADNRVRLFFDGKPAADIRSRLKGCGFRWAPSIGAWQAYRNPRSLSVAAEMITKGAA